ncbi:M14 family metallopeptidase [Couchioplanes caeruleus]|uniref:Zinc carboxypeptidase n=2 Tax=Couchioplanes caeruleus TaxID=56438 RepID=A0A1K0GYW8_9ACTN|nr:M14 family metallopeptidase [Couchioplanes caeruleus]OJF14619.1 peptidase M14 [Couchioplanes caeruleus subsp. caeruleus]ROP33137.1 immune inhibitor A peptidase M6 [Couchioplanes caeruleus]
MTPARWATACALSLVTAAAAVLPGIAPAAAAPADDPLRVYVGTLDAAQLEKLRAVGIDHDESAVTAAANGKIAVETILGERQAERLVAAGVPLTAKRTTARMRAEASAAPTVFRPYAAPGGIRDELSTTAARHPRLAKLVTIGKSVKGVPIQAVKVTRDARVVRDGRRPAVLYLGGQHAREWITPEMNRRLLHHVLDSYGTDATITTLLNTTELWFLPVANPDGYDFTFTEGHRLWRKNLRDNNGDGQITTGDGVDLNRNFAEKWAYDNEGSSPDPASETFRGPAPGSEPETKALDGLFERVGFEFLINYHSAAELLLYGIGWQVNTPSPDDTIAVALVGDDAHPAVPGYDPDISAELYTTNGDTDYHAQARTGTIGFTPEMSTCQTISGLDPDDRWNPDDCESGFNFPDDEKLIQDEFLKNLPFALSVAQSAKDPANPVSVVGRSTPDLAVDAFSTSYGSAQEVAVTARRGLRAITLHYSINGARARTARTAEFEGGERYGDALDRYFAEVRGAVPSARPGDKVKVWFTARKGRATVTSADFTYTVADKIGGDVLVLAAEDVTGISPAATDGATSARYADEHVASLKKAGYRADVYDLDTQGRAAPHPLGVLSHYKAVVWETGDDVIPRAPGQPAGTVARSALETELAVRDYLNEGGKLLFGGKNAGFAQSADGSYRYLPEGPGECTDTQNPACLQLFNDFQQYWLGAYSYVDEGGTGADGNPLPLVGNAGAFDGFSATPGAGHTAAFLSTSSFLDPKKFPQFASSAAPLDWKLPGAAPYEPYDGDWYLWSGQSDSSYKRLTKTVDLTGAQAARLKFRTSFDVETDWDFMFVEAHEVGTDTWTTLPDAGGLTTTGTGESCKSGVADLHPFLAHYQGAECTPTGTTGTWNAATGSSGGWKEFDADLSAYAGKKVELSISYMSDWGTQGLGVFLDDVRVETGGTVAERTSFEGDLGGWTVAGPPPGSGTNSTDWSRSRLAFDSGAAVTTTDSVYLGFGLETLAPADRDELVRRAMKHLKVPSFRG